MLKTLRSAALAAALLTCALALPAGATSSIGSGQLAAVNDDVNTSVNGAYHATAVVTLFGTFSATVVWEMSTDGGTNWLSAPYAKRIDVVSTNPTVAASATAAGTYEFELPANANAVRARCSSYTSGTVNAQVRPGRPYQPGVPVTATLYDASTTFGVGLNSGTLDVSGWSALMGELDNKDTGGTSRTLIFIPVWSDAASSPGLSPSVSVSTGNAGYLTVGQGVSVSGAGVLPPRVAVQVSAGTGTAGTARVVVYAKR